VTTGAASTSGGGPGPSEEAHLRAQLTLIEDRLLAEFGGDVERDAAVREHLAVATAAFAGARIRRYLAILVERDARGRLRGTGPPGGPSAVQRLP
jgi:hypothetical protein